MNTRMSVKMPMIYKKRTDHRTNCSQCIQQCTKLDVIHWIFRSYYFGQWFLFEFCFVLARTISLHLSSHNYQLSVNDAVMQKTKQKIHIHTNMLNLTMSVLLLVMVFFRSTSLLYFSNRSPENNGHTNLIEFHVGCIDILISLIHCLHNVSLVSCI